MNSTPSSAEREFRLEEKDFRFLVKLAYEQTGIVLTEQKRDMLYGRLARRLRTLGLSSFADYCSYLQSEHGHQEIGHLVNAITTNLTHFFREMHHFEHLRDEVLKPLAKSAAGKPRLRIWSSACSSGMEPYSIAMTMRSAIPDLAKWDARILATDIDSNMLDIGKKGDYAASDLARIPEEYHRYVSEAGNHITMNPELRELIAFRSLNLLESWPMKGPFDAIFCRNVAIYFDKPTKQQIFKQMATMLRPGGWLYIGHSETLHDISTEFQLIGRTIYRKI